MDVATGGTFPARSSNKTLQPKYSKADYRKLTQRRVCTYMSNGLPQPTVSVVLNWQHPPASEDFLPQKGTCVRLESPNLAGVPPTAPPKWLFPSW
mmetsp:Transcript_67523/g.150744  ORF Transcript_67523/g.150744 Transcript_67523/m.150744 type:complete len:95 (-) Transcript_67523:166-450(-)